MRMLRSVIIAGLRRSSRLRLLLPLYVGGLLAGLLQTWPLMLANAQGGLHNPFLGQLAGGGADALVNLFLGQSSVSTRASLWALAALGSAAVVGLLYAFFSGGVLHVYAGNATFWAGCRGMFWPFLGLGVLLIVLWLALIAFTWVAGAVAGWSTAVIVALVLLQVLNLLGEYARVLAVVRGRANPFVLIGMAVVFCARNLGGTLVLAALGLGLHVGLFALYSGVAPLLGAAPLLALWQQVVVFAWIWIKFLRLAWALSYAEQGTSGAGQRVSFRQPELAGG